MIGALGAIGGATGLLGGGICRDGTPSS